MANTACLVPKTLRDAWVLYVDYLAASGQQKIKAVAQTALFRYTLPGYGLPPGSKTKAALEFMSQVPLVEFVDALNIQQNCFDDVDLKKKSQHANRHRLKQMLEWCSAQPWWEKATKAEPGIFCPRRRQMLGNAHHVKTTQRRGVTRYSLKNLKPAKLKDVSPDEVKRMEAELARLNREVQKLYKFMTATHVPRRQDPAIRQPTAGKVINFIWLIYGWLYSSEQIPLEKLGLDCFNDVTVAYDYVNWLEEERNVSPKTELQAVVACTHVAKFNHHWQSNQDYCEQMTKSYCDVEIVNDLRRLLRAINERVKSAPVSVADESKKWLQWPEYLACIEFLKDDCGLLTSDGDPRTERAIARSYERYLIAALLGYMPPDRQRTVRELVLGKSLIKGYIEQGVFHPDVNGSWFIRLEADDYKTGSAYGRHVQQVPETVYPYLEEWLNSWRSVLTPQHDFVFTQLNGKPLSSESLYQLFRHAIYRASVNLFGEGKAPNPHLIRDMLVTHCYEIGASEAQMDGLALAMKHSRRTQRESYDRRSQHQKIQPALELMATFESVDVFSEKYRKPTQGHLESIS